MVAVGVGVGIKKYEPCRECDRAPPCAGVTDLLAELFFDAVPGLGRGLRPEVGGSRGLFGVVAAITGGLPVDVAERQGFPFGKFFDLTVEQQPGHVAECQVGVDVGTTAGVFLQRRVVASIASVNSTGPSMQSAGLMGTKSGTRLGGSSGKAAIVRSPNAPVCRGSISMMFGCQLTQAAQSISTLVAWAVQTARVMAITPWTPTAT